MQTQHCLVHSMCLYVANNIEHTHACYGYALSVATPDFDTVREAFGNVW